MASLVKLAIVSKSGEEASFLQKLDCLSSSLLSSRKTAISCVYWLLANFCTKHFTAHTCPIYKNHVMQNGR